MALDKAKADETPFPPPDISSPRSNFENLSFICSSAVIINNNINFNFQSKKEFGLNLQSKKPRIYESIHQILPACNCASMDSDEATLGSLSLRLGVTPPRGKDGRSTVLYFPG